MKNKILKLVLILMLVGALIVLTGCGEGIITNDSNEDESAVQSDANDSDETDTSDDTTDDDGYPLVTEVRRLNIRN